AGARGQRPKPGPSPRHNPEMEAALRQIVPITPGVREDDHPAIASAGGRVWLAWVSFSETEGTSQIFARSMEGGKWQAPGLVREQPGDYPKPAITGGASGAGWGAWPAPGSGNAGSYGPRPAGAGARAGG